MLRNGREEEGNPYEGYVCVSQLVLGPAGEFMLITGQLSAFRTMTTSKLQEGNNITTRLLMLLYACDLAIQ
jgi:hypothetical protein